MTNVISECFGFKLYINNWHLQNESNLILIIKTVRKYFNNVLRHYYFFVNMSGLISFCLRIKKNGSK